MCAYVVVYTYIRSDCKYTVLHFTCTNIRASDTFVARRLNRTVISISSRRRVFLGKRVSMEKQKIKRNHRQRFDINDTRIQLLRGILKDSDNEETVTISERINFIDEQ